MLVWGEIPSRQLACSPFKAKSLANKKVPKTQAKRGNRALFDEPTQFVGVRLPVSAVSKIDELIAANPRLFRDRSDFIRDVILTATARDQALIREKISSLIATQAELTPSENAEETARELVRKALELSQNNSDLNFSEANKSLEAIDALVEKHGFTVGEANNIVMEEINNFYREKQTTSERHTSSKANKQSRKAGNVPQAERKETQYVKTPKS